MRACGTWVLLNHRKKSTRCIGAGVPSAPSAQGTGAISSLSVFPIPAPVLLSMLAVGTGRSPGRGSAIDGVLLCEERSIGCWLSIRAISNVQVRVTLSAVLDIEDNEIGIRLVMQ